MVTVFTKFPIKKEYREEYAKHLVEAVKEHNIDKQEGYKGMKLLAPQPIHQMSENNMFIIETLWQDMESFMVYTKSEAFKKSHKNLPPREWFEGKPEVEVYESIG
ncbi:MAG: antibiotic biosynthesis monooxygenase [Epsilonproteobacteria bacterium]|nr:antibiotic biosynthesis monooxygenase [Campylobacterota bacterium]